MSKLYSRGGFHSGRSEIQICSQLDNFVLLNMGQLSVIGGFKVRFSVFKVLGITDEDA